MVGLFFTIGCTPTETISKSPQTNTVEHSWQSESVIATLYYGVGVFGNSFSQVPEIVIYSDGTVIYSETDWANNIRTIHIGQAEFAKICSLLYAVESSGFFNYKQSDYEEPQVTDLGTTYIEINGWANNSIAAYALGSFDPNENDQSDSPLLITQELLRQFKFMVNDSKPYIAERILVSLHEIGNHSPAPLWPLDEFPLAELANVDNHWNESLLEGESANLIGDLFSNKSSAIYSDGERTYQLSVRPILPAQIVPNNSSWHDIPEFSTESTEINCYFQDKIEHPMRIDVEPTVESVPRGGDKTAQAPLELIKEIGERNGEEQLHYAGGFIVTAEGEYLLADSGNNRLLRYSAEGLFVDSVPLTNEADRPASIVLLPDNTIMLADQFADIIEIITIEGESLKKISGWPEPDLEKQAHDKFTQVVPGTNGLFYGAETRGKRIVTLSETGEIIETWRGPLFNQLDDIRDLATDIHGNLYIAIDRQDRVIRRSPNGEVQEFFIEDPTEIAPLDDLSFYAYSSKTFYYYSADGELLNSWSDETLNWSIEDLIALPDKTIAVMQSTFGSPYIDEVIRHYSADGQKMLEFGSNALLPGQFENHSAFSISMADDIWVIDIGGFYSHKQDVKLVHLNKKGDHINTFANLESEDLQCISYQLSALTDHSVLVANPCTNKVTHINSEGNSIDHWGETGNAIGQFSLIEDIQIARDQQSVYILDSGLNILYRFKLNGDLLESHRLYDWGIKQPIAFDFATDEYLYLLDEATQEIVVIDKGQRVNSWQLPDQDQRLRSIAADPNSNYVYVAGHDVSFYMFDNKGSYLGRRQVWDSSNLSLEVGRDGQLYRSGGFQGIQVFSVLIK